jgi:Signal peptidase (SPase) II
MAATGERRPPRRRLAVLITVAAVVLAADVASKAAVVARLSGRPHVRLLGGLLTLTVTRNPGAAFGIGGPTVTVACTAIAAGVAVLAARGTAAREVHPSRGEGDHEPGPSPAPMLVLVLVPVKPGPAPLPGPAGPAGSP